MDIWKVTRRWVEGTGDSEVVLWLGAWKDSPELLRAAEEVQSPLLRGGSAPAGLGVPGRTSRDMACAQCLLQGTQEPGARV